MKLRSVTTIILLSVFGLITYAQQMAPLPIDPKVKYGKLENGLTYYIRHNAFPKNRAEFYIAQNVGSILENDSQRGLAHFLEHKLFEDEQGRDVTLDFVKLGADVNAFTTLDKTTYYFSTLDHFEESLELLLKFTSKFTSSEDAVNHEKRIIEQENPDCGR